MPVPTARVFVPVTSADLSTAGANRVGAWMASVTPDVAAVAVRVAVDVASRLRSPEQVEEAAAAARTQTTFPRSTHWIPFTIAQGYAGLAVLWSYLDSCFPGEGWDSLGRSHLEQAVRGAETAASRDPGLFSGLSGLAFAGWTLSRGGTRYRRLLSSLDGAISASATELATALAARRTGVTVGEFDVISGLSGIGAYLLCRREQLEVEASWEAVVEALVQMTLAEDGLPRWHTPADLMWDEGMLDIYPHGSLNCGLAHGIPGPLAFMSLSFRAGSRVPGLPEAIARIGDWLNQNRVDDQWGVNWSTAVPLEQLETPDGPIVLPARSTSAPDGPARCAWCYGSPGIARALWLAGGALERADFRDLAVSAMEAVFRRPIAVRRIDSSTFCHGVAGLLQIVLRFVNDTSGTMFVAESRRLVTQLLRGYQPDSLLGYRYLEVPGNEIDQPGLLDGTPGVALVLLAASTPVEPVWDRLFLLS